MQVFRANSRLHSAEEEIQCATESDKQYNDVSIINVELVVLCVIQCKSHTTNWKKVFLAGAILRYLVPHLPRLPL